jgi:cysteinyl-tRNA synthetase
LIAYLWSLLKNTDICGPLKFHAISLFDQILGLDLKGQELVLTEEVKRLLKDREIARADKNFVLADKLRSQIAALGYGLLDTVKGQVVKKR